MLGLRLIFAVVAAAIVVAIFSGAPIREVGFAPRIAALAPIGASDKIRQSATSPHPSEFPDLQPGPRVRTAVIMAEQACERNRSPADAALYERARPIILADANGHAYGAPVELLEATISAEFPSVICGAVHFEAYGGMWRFVYENGRVHGRWRDLAEPQPLIAAYCRAPARSCWLVHD